MMYFAEAPLLLEAPKDALASIVAFCVLFIPLLMIPFAFKLAGGIVGRVNQFLGGYGSKITEAVKGNPNDPNSLRNKYRRRLGDSFTQNQAQVMREGQVVGASRFGALRSRFIGSGLFGDVQGRSARTHKEATQIREDKTNFMDDSEVYAASGYALEAGTTITPEMASFLRPAGGGTFAAGSTLTGRRYFDSKGSEISSVLYNRSLRLHGMTQPDLSENLSYAFYKAQTDERRSAARFAFAQNALQRGWTQQQIDVNWAKAVYGRKDIDITQWYSKPTLTTNPATGAPMIQYKDVGDDLGAFNDMTEEMNQSRTAFQLTPERDGGFRAMLEWQKQLEQKAMTTGSLTSDEHKALVKTYQIFDATSQRMASPQYGEGGELISASGATPESQAVIKEAIRSRQLALSPYDSTDGTRTFRPVIPPPVGAPPGTAPTYGPAVGVTGGVRPPTSDATSRPKVVRNV